MKTVFVDTSDWLALINKTDHLHHTARGVRDDLLEQGFRFLVTDYILVETANALSRIPFRKAGPFKTNSIPLLLRVFVTLCEPYEESAQGPRVSLSSTIPLLLSTSHPLIFCVSSNPHLHRALRGKSKKWFASPALLVYRCRRLADS